MRRVCAPRLAERSKSRRAFGGQAVIESIASIIMFTLLLGLVMCVTVYLYFQQALVTAAREGARQASLNDKLNAVATESAGMAEVRNYVADQVLNLTGQTYSPGVATITVTPPSASANQTPGERMVSVRIDWNMTNPVGVGNMINALDGEGDNFLHIPVHAMATMRYEE